MSLGLPVTGGTRPPPRRRRARPGGRRVAAPQLRRPTASRPASCSQAAPATWAVRPPRPTRSGVGRDSLQTGPRKARREAGLRLCRQRRRVGNAFKRRKRRRGSRPLLQASLLVHRRRVDPPSRALAPYPVTALPGNLQHTAAPRAGGKPITLHNIYYRAFLR